ncbi:hypothetical protein SAMN04488066_103120 [Halorubrum aquaticum]|uniref:Halobacterial output domain-containing protein n=1 Tax=Halorubrum aquaticum TaxID=387340 RepID=A0A1I2ZTL3_9EURY|nr:HalOD1 output domain-containing protein [Halorubrum aquaticum]SFH41197.1 hypothetical protein SAMN04488066_103120 [Halorubrum aquaticum]
MTQQRDYSGREDEGPCSETASKTYTSTFARGSDKTVSIRVVETVAEAIETDLEDLRPLYDTIDSAALNMLFESPHRFGRGCVKFRYEGCTVTVSADEWIAVSPRTNDGE